MVRAGEYIALWVVCLAGCSMVVSGAGMCGEKCTDETQARADELKEALKLRGNPLPFEEVVRLDAETGRSTHNNLILKRFSAFEDFTCISKEEKSGTMHDFVECDVKVPEMYAQKAYTDGLVPSQAFAKLALETHGVMVLPISVATQYVRFQISPLDDVDEETLKAALDRVHSTHKSITKKYGRERPQILNKTPYPCKKEYPKEELQAAALKHISHAKEDNEHPHLLMLLGGSAAGKGTFIRHLQRSGVDILNFVFNGLDEYLEYLPEFQQSLSDPKAVYKDAADDCYGGGAIPLAKIAGAEIIKRKQNVIYEETGKNLKRIFERVLPPYEGAGYRVTVVLVDNDPEIAKMRASDRFLLEGRYAAPDYIEGTFKNVVDNFKTLRTSGRVAEAVYCDNSCSTEGDQKIPLHDALTRMNCLKCWREEPKANEKQALIPDDALYIGKPVYFKGFTNEEL